MAEKEEKGTTKPKEVDPDLRYKYLGFEVKPGKIGDLFKSDAEKQSWVQRIQEKRKKRGVRLRDECTLEEPRVASYERIVLTITSVLLVVGLFLPWFSGYKLFTVQPKETATEQTGATATTPDAQKDAGGFTSVTMTKKTVETRREYYSASALGALGSIGLVFSSGFILMLSGFLMIIYMLLCIGLAGYTLYALYGVKGDPDTTALNLKRVLKWNWIPVVIWVFCLIISSFGASYGFDPKGMLVQLGSSYGISAFLGLFSYGFYLTLACFVMNAVKAVEI